MNHPEKLKRMKVCLITDIYNGPIGGLPLLCLNVYEELKRQGHDVHVIYPDLFEYTYNQYVKEIKIAIDTWTIKEKLEALQPDFIVIMSEINLTSAAITYCGMKNIPFTTLYQTKLPEFGEKVMNVPTYTTYKYLDWFHYKASCVLTISESMTKQLIKGTSIRNIKQWFGGTNTSKFHPSKKALMDQFNPEFKTWQKPVLLYVSRASPEKNIEAFLSLEYKGTKVFIGDGMLLEELRAKYPDVKCLGLKTGDELSAYYASVDVFVFPSKCDAFGMVNIEALASGTPVVGFNATGVSDIVEVGINGYLAEDNDLKNAITKALLLDRDLVFKTSSKWSLKESVKLIVANGQLVDSNKWFQTTDPTLKTLLTDFQIGIHLMAIAFYLCCLHIYYGVINFEGVQESFAVITHSWFQDLKKISYSNTKKQK